MSKSVASAPSDEKLKVHFEQLLNLSKLEESEDIDLSDSPYIPVLDDKFLYFSSKQPIQSRRVFQTEQTYFSTLWRFSI